jgi:hypothetical protein
MPIVSDTKQGTADWPTVTTKTNCNKILIGKLQEKRPLEIDMHKLKTVLKLITDKIVKMED